MQVLVEHPEAFVKHIKQCLSSKEGIPVKQQRLVFSGPGAQALEESQEASKQQPAVEEILSSLSQWQVGQSQHCAFSASFEGTRVAALHNVAKTAGSLCCYTTPPHALSLCQLFQKKSRFFVLRDVLSFGPLQGCRALHGQVVASICKSVEMVED